MADVATVLSDPKFRSLPIEERRKVISTLDPNFGQLHINEQNKVLGYTAPRKSGGQNVLDYTTDTLSNIPGSTVRLLGNVGTAISHPIDTAENLGKIITGTAQNMTPGYVTPQRPGYSAEANQAWDALKNRYGSIDAFAETLRTDPVGVASDVAALAGGVSGLAKGTAAVADLSNLPRVANAARSTAKTAATVSDAVNPMKLITKPAGYVMKATGKGLIRSALPGIGGRAERFGATPATAILEETKGFTPAAVKVSADAKLADLRADLARKAAAAEQSGVTLDLTGARDVVDKGIADAQLGNGLVDDLTPMRAQLNTPRPGFGGTTVIPPGSSAPVISPQQPPSVFLPMKHQFGEDFTKFDYAVPQKSRVRSLGNKAYHEMSSEFNTKIPDAVPTNQQMQSLIPGRDAAQRAAETNGPFEKAIDRATRPTGGLAAALFGFHAGGVPGAMLASGMQETLSSPTARILAARAAYGSGNALTSPITSRVFNTAGVAGSIPRFARGGIIRKPTWGLVGEDGPEAIVPLPKDSMTIPSVRLKPKRNAKQRAAIFEAMRRNNAPPSVRLR